MLMKKWKIFITIIIIVAIIIIYILRLPSEMEKRGYKYIGVYKEWTIYEKESNQCKEIKYSEEIGTYCIWADDLYVLKNDETEVFMQSERAEGIFTQEETELIIDIIFQ